jgi:hypothetical protein
MLYSRRAERAVTARSELLLYRTGSQRAEHMTSSVSIFHTLQAYQQALLLDGFPSSSHYFVSYRRLFERPIMLRKNNPSLSVGPAYRAQRPEAPLTESDAPVCEISVKLRALESSLHSLNVIHRLSRSPPKAAPIHRRGDNYCLRERNIDLTDSLCSGYRNLMCSSSAFNRVCDRKRWATCVYWFTQNIHRQCQNCPSHGTPVPAWR